MKSCLLISLLLFCGPARADDPISVPAVYRNAADFYGAIGSGIRVSYSVSPATVAIGDATTLTLSVSNVRNPAEVTRPPLDSMPGFTSKFQIEPGETSTEKNAVRFQYALRPRTAGPIAVPRLRFSFFNPAAAEGKQLQTAYADSVTITVTESRTAAAMTLPEQFRTAVPENDSILRVGPWTWLIVVPFSLLSIPVVVWIIRRSGAFSKAKSKSRAAIAASRALSNARHSADPAGAASAAVRDYLITRPDLVEAPLKSFFTQCDAVRFSPMSDNGLSLVADAERWIAEWEAWA